MNFQHRSFHKNCTFERYLSFSQSTKIIRILRQRSTNFKCVILKNNKTKIHTIVLTYPSGKNITKSMWNNTFEKLRILIGHNTMNLSMRLVCSDIVPLDDIYSSDPCTVSGLLHHLCCSNMYFKQLHVDP